MHNLDFFIFKIVLTDVRLPFDVGAQTFLLPQLNPFVFAH